jgi:LacI family transcriptional regulator
MGVTLKHVAEKAGVSLQTVWRAIHDAPGILPSTRAEILEIANELGYRRNRIAGSLRSSESHTVGLLVLDVSNAYTSEVTRGVEEEAAKHGYSVLLMNSDDDIDRQRRAVTSLLERRVDGLIMNPCSEGDHSYLNRELTGGFPLVAINRPIPGVPSVTISSRHQDTYRAARYLARTGHRRIGGIFGNFSNTPFYGRYRSLVRELERQKLPVRAEWLRSGSNTVAFGREAIQALMSLSDKPTAVFAAGNRLTEGALLGLRDLGLRHGLDVTLVGFDLRYAELLDPPLPVLRQPARDMGRVAVTTLLRIIGGKRPANPRPLPISLSVDGIEQRLD